MVFLNDTNGIGDLPASVGYPQILLKDHAYL
jgi:hypothetical protein